MMSRQLSLSSTLCALVMVLFVLAVRTGTGADASGAATQATAPLASFEISR